MTSCTYMHYNSRSQAELGTGEYLDEVASAAHEVKNSLTILKGYASYALLGYLGPLDSGDQEALTQLVDGVDRVVAVVTHLLSEAEAHAHERTTRSSADERPERREEASEGPC